MMARHLSDIPVVVGRQRYLAGQVALARFNVDVLLLDDAYQHRQLGRDVDILTVPATYPFGNPGGLLLAGTLRESPTALRRADIILLTHADTSNIAVDAKEAVKRLAPNALVLESTHQPTHLYPVVSRRQWRTYWYRSTRRETASCGLWDRKSRKFCCDAHAVFSREC